MYLGIDPWVRKLWFAIIDGTDIIDAGILLQEAEGKVTRDTYYQRMHHIYQYFIQLLIQYEGQIQWVGIEKLFFTDSNQANAEFVYGIRGALAMLITNYGIPIVEYTPIELKKHITGNGKAGKELVQRVIKQMFGLENLPEYDDAADALGLARLAQKKLQNKNTK